jgi:hypothetical protein
MPFALCALAVASAADAASQRTFVASYGSDASATCSLAAPCRAFAAAIAQTNPGGEVIVLDSAGYGPVTITKAVSIIAPAGVYAGVSVATGDGIVVNAGATDVVKLRGLRLNGTGGANGIVATAVGLLDIARVEVAGFTSRGLDFAAPDGRLTVADSPFLANGGSGLVVAPATGSATVTVRHSRFDQNTLHGVVIGTNATGGIFDSSASNNLGTAFRVEGGGSAAVSDCRVVGNGATGMRGLESQDTGSRMSVSRCALSGMQYAAIAVLGATLDVADTTVTSSYVGYEAHYGSIVNAERSSAVNGTYGFLVSGAGTNVLRMSNCVASFNANGVFTNPGSTIYSRGNNTIRANTLDIGGTGTFTTFAQQ